MTDAGRRSAEDLPTADPPDADLKTLAKGGRTNIFGFVLRLAARLPFLFIAGRMYGLDALGRFAYAIIVIEFAAQLATMGLKRGLAQQLATSERDQGCDVWDAMLVSFLASLVAAGLLMLVPQAMFPNSALNGLDALLPLAIVMIAGSDVALSALAYRHDLASTVRARAIIEPWTLAIVAFALAFVTRRDGLIIAYVASMVAAFTASLLPLIRTFGPPPPSWRPRPQLIWALARRNTPLAAADAIEWASRRVDIAVLGLFVEPRIVGVYWGAQQVASLPQKLKTSFDSILAPVITQNLASDNRAAVARHVGQVTFWIIAAQLGTSLYLGIPGEAVMGLVGPAFVGGTGALAILLVAEICATPGAVAESALVYVARMRNLAISLGIIALEIALCVGFLLVARAQGFNTLYQAAAVALGLAFALLIGSVAKTRLLSSLLGTIVSGWRWALVAAGVAAAVPGVLATMFLPQWAELAVGVPAIIAVYLAAIWRLGFGPEDRELLRVRRASPQE